MSDFETAHQLEQASASRGNLPSELAFAAMVKNRTAPPCSLNDFMDYLFYVEHNAEPLQFFLWYCDYVQRWSGLLPRQKALSPRWDPDKATEPRSRFITYSHKRERSDKMSKIIAIMEMSSEMKEPEPLQDHEIRKSTSSSTSKIARPRTPPSAVLSPTESIRADWQPFTIQPFRDEISRVIKQYVAESAPRQLDLTDSDREACLHAAQHTTHPSALLPAFTYAEANLRGHLHPNFLRWSRSNSNAARVRFLRILGIFLVFLGLGLDILLILSGRSNFLRVICLIPWWPGLTVLIAASRSLCIALHCLGVRQLRPWEQEHLIDGGEGDHGGDSTSRPSFSSSFPLTVKENNIPPQKQQQHSRQNSHEPRQHVHKNTHASNNLSFSSTTTTTTTSTSRIVDPLRKPSLQTFGPRNDYGQEEAWAASYQRKTVLARIFDETAPVQNEALRLLQDRTIFFAVLLGGLGATALTVGSLFAPAGNLFL
ncbi:hypothetical protein B0T19DRAFT_259327 [Cercophora scortea]|uniref:RGS domain-containing protein n=1 Tax=Cercophora scortea TaxID=314031 RepID=A0AAE0IAJ9_9PEZI|nr:hypothetical protein B0T19DRAFT_259327 [Cercophora scortea]